MVGVFTTGGVIVEGRALHVACHHPTRGKRWRPLTRRRLAGGLGRPTTRRWAVGHRVSPRGRQPRRHIAVGAVATAAVGARLLLLPPFKRELTCEAAALDEAKEVVALPQLGRSQDLVVGAGRVVAPPTPPSHRPCRPMHRPLPHQSPSVRPREEDAEGVVGLQAEFAFGEGL